MLASILLAAALLVPSASALAPGREAEIDRMAANWTNYRVSANQMLAVFPGNFARDGGDGPGTGAALEKVQALFDELEDVQATLADIVREDIRRDPPSAGRDARERAAEELLNVNRLILYGNFVPRLLDGAVEDRQGRRIGRRYAGPGWAICADYESELRPYSDKKFAATGYTSRQYDEFRGRARAFLRLPPEEPR